VKSNALLETSWSERAGLGRKVIRRKTGLHFELTVLEERSQLLVLLIAGKYRERNGFKTGEALVTKPRKPENGITVYCPQRSFVLAGSIEVRGGEELLLHRKGIVC